MLKVYRIGVVQIKKNHYKNTNNSYKTSDAYLFSATKTLLKNLFFDNAKIFERSEIPLIIVMQCVFCAL